MTEGLTPQQSDICPTTDQYCPVLALSKEHVTLADGTPMFMQFEEDEIHAALIEQGQEHCGHEPVRCGLVAIAAAYSIHMTTLSELDFRHRHAKNEPSPEV